MSGEKISSLRIALAQYNPVVGDIEGNAARVRQARTQAAEQDAQLVVFPELFLSGYPPEDLVLKPAFIVALREAVNALAAATADGGPGVLLGVPWEEAGKVYNAVVLLDHGEVAAIRYKYDLPNYGVFDEKRVFAAGPLPGPVNFRGVRIGVPICEDIWAEEVCECLQETGSELFIVINGSPFSLNKFERRMNVAVARVAETGLPLVYVNQVGGQDELVFDGASFVLNADAGLALQAPAWEEDLAISAWTRQGEGWRCTSAEKSLVDEGDGATYLACVTGLRDYVRKNGFPSVLIGLSGGIDSALCAAISVDALGPDKVHCVMLP
ncbi:MAG: NAD+ synthase, partial [Alphaproteobacteria bacterium]